MTRTKLCFRLVVVFLFVLWVTSFLLLQRNVVKETGPVTTEASFPEEVKELVLINPSLAVEEKRKIENELKDSSKKELSSIVTTQKEEEEEKYSLGETYKNPEIIRNGCSVTVLLVDPRVFSQRRNSELWYSFESMAVNMIPIETTCVIIQTSFVCHHTSSEAIYEKIKSHSLKGFRSLIDKGNVRVVHLDYSNYRIHSACNWNVNRLFMHPNYWEDEFLEQDSDHVLVIQHDSVLCHSFNVSRWNDLAFIGGVWPPRPGLHNNPFPRQGVCNAIPEYWNKWKGPGAKSLSYVCNEDGLAPLGNGGFSFRSRNWMKRVINNCPSPFVSTPKRDCSIQEDYPEDIYFAVGMRGFNAPMPTAIEAALFGVEMIFLEKVIEYYPSRTTNISNVVLKRWGDLHKFNEMQKSLTTVPIGMHKPWWYHDRKVLSSEFMKRECPFLEHILPK